MQPSFRQVSCRLSRSVTKADVDIDPYKLFLGEFDFDGKPLELTYNSGARKRPSNILSISFCLGFSEDLYPQQKLQHLNGLELVPATQFGTRYYIAIVKGRIGDYFPERARLGPDDFQMPGWIHKVGLHFDIDTWDGSDVFTPVGRAHMLLSQKALEAFGSFSSNALEFTPVSEVGFYLEA